MSAAKKDTIYIDVDDDITAIVDKVQSSSAKIVALVLPKRAAVLQSIVNMKLLKRTADDAKKNLVLVTSEAGLLPLAGMVGVHVAKTPQSKPVIPESPKPMDAPVTVDADDLEDAGAVRLDPTAPIGALAGLPIRDTNQEDVIEVDNDDDEVEVAPAAVPAKKQAINKKLKVPNFDAFRTRLFVGLAALLLLVVGWYVAFYVMPRANIVIKTNNVTVTSDLQLTASTTTKTVDAQNGIVPAESKLLKKTDSQKVTATGQKDAGTKASGKVTLSLNDCSQPQVTVPSGTSVSADGQNFVTQVDVTLQSVRIGTQCRNSDFKEVSTGTVKVVAEKAGDQYNLSPRDYTVAGFKDVTGTGSAMSGGTSKIITVVQQSDIDGAKQKILDSDNASASTDISNQLTGDGYIPLTDTLSSGDPLVTSTPNVGDEATDVTVTVVVNYTMTGVQKDGVKQLLEADINKHIDTSKQNILDNGLDKAVIRVTDNKQSDGSVAFTLQTNATAGVQQDADAIKKAVAGKKKGEVQSIILNRPGVKDVNVTYSPFWVYGTPKSTSKINVTFQNDGSTNQ